MGQWLSWFWPFSGPSIEQKKQRWSKEQTSLRARMLERNTEPWQCDSSLTGLRWVAGMDISFIKGDEVNACAALVVLSFPELEVVYSDCCMMKLTEPYIAGYLAFREAPIYVELYEKLVSSTGLKPQLLMVDGNGKLHCQGFGIASQLGVLLDVPTVGVAKTLYHVDGLENNLDHKNRMNTLTNDGDSVPLEGDSGTIYGAALRSTAGSKNPIYVSVGHRISLEIALRVVHRCCKHRVPEPTRLADIQSREYLRRNFPP